MGGKRMMVGLPACRKKEGKKEMQNLTMSNSAFLSFTVQGRQRSSRPPSWFKGD